MSDTRESEIIKNNSELRNRTNFHSNSGQAKLFYSQKNYEKREYRDYMITHEALFLVEDLFRLGNASSPRLDQIRKHDIPIIDRDGKEMVFPDTGGISAFNTIHPRLHGIWWKCPAGTTYPEELTIICERDYGGLRHYLIQPSYQMELRQYLGSLREFALSFDKVT